MKKVLVILVVLAMTGIASAALIDNPEGWDSYASGTVLDGPEGDKTGGGGATWSGWGDSDAGNGTGFSYTAGSGASAVVVMNAPGVGWGYNLLFNHGNVVATLPDGGNALGFATLEFDLLSKTAGDALVKLEYYDAAGNQLRVDAWDNPGYEAGEGSAIYPDWLTPTNGVGGTSHHVFTTSIPAGAVYLSPVVGVTGPGSQAVYDNIELTANVVPEPATMALLGLGALVLRRKK